MRWLMIVAAALIIAPRSWGADSTIIWSAEVRVRGEADGRDFNNATPLFGYSTLRARIAARVQPSAGVHLFVQIQDGRLFGAEQPSVVPNTSTPQSQFLDLHQGYLEIEHLAFDGLTLQAGRMELSYGDEQFVGANDWGLYGQAFDAVRFRVGAGGHAADLFAAKIVRSTTLPEPVSPYTVVQPPDEGYLLSGLWYNLPPVVPVALSAYFFHEWDHHDNRLSRGTLGMHVSGSAGCWIAAAEGAYQAGHVDQSGLSAFMLLASVGYSFPGELPDTVSAGFNYLSGTGPADEKGHTFATSFASPHDRFGAMDYFGDPAVGTNGRGLQDLYLRGSMSIAATFSVSIGLHQFYLAKAWSGENDLGQEADLGLRFSAWPTASLEGGVSVFHPATVMKAWYNQSDLSVWGYVGAKVWL